MTTPDAPSCAVTVDSEWAFAGKDGVVDLISQLQRSPPPPSVSASRNSRKFVQLQQLDNPPILQRSFRPRHRRVYA